MDKWQDSGNTRKNGLMVETLVILACLQGVGIGLFCAEIAARRKDLAERLKLNESLVAAQKGLAELHNKNVETMRVLQDKVNAHSMAFASSGRV